MTEAEFLVAYSCMDLCLNKLRRFRLSVPREATWPVCSEEVAPRLGPGDHVLLEGAPQNNNDDAVLGCPDGQDEVVPEVHRQFSRVAFVVAELRIKPVHGLAMHAI